jgi:hypothetical protein
MQLAQSGKNVFGAAIVSPLQIDDRRQKVKDLGDFNQVY